jgi:hypothetical protein
MQPKDPKQRKPSANRAGHIELTKGLVLDDFLATIDGMRRTFQLPVSQFSLKNMEETPRVREALEILIRSTIDRYGKEIYSIRHPLLSKISRSIYSRPFVSKVSPRRRIAPKWTPKALEKLLEVSLQTLPQLPKRDPKPDHSPGELRLLASHLRNVSEEANALPSRMLSFMKLRP